MQRISEIWPDWHADELIGQGAYGKVYRASREIGGRTLQAAIKVIDIPRDEAEVTALRQMGMDALSVRSYFEETAQTVINELAIMDSLKGAPNVVGIEDYQMTERGDGVGWTVFIRMELLEALPAHIERVGMPSQHDAARAGVHLCRALGYCHELGVIHRDVKPSNVFWGKFGDYKLGDFGLARTIEVGSRSTKSRAGTEDFMAPEVATGHYDYRVDIYSLGSMLYRWLNGGKPPFISASENPNRAKLDESQLRRLSGERPPLPSGEGVDPALAAIVRKAVEPKPEDRWATAREFGEALQAWLDGAPPEVKGPKVTEVQGGSEGEGGSIVVKVPEITSDEPIRLKDVTVDEIPDQQWEGKSLCPEVLLSYEGERLEPEVDYTVAYADNGAPGTASVKLSGIGRFAGKRTVKFTILPAKAAEGAEDLGPVKCEYPAILSAKQLDAVAKHFLKNCQSVWRPNPNTDDDDDYDCYPPTDVVSVTCFEDEISESQASEMRRVLGIVEDDTIYVLWDRKTSSFFKTTYQSFVICDSGIYYRAAKTSGHVGWEKLRAMPAMSIVGAGRELLFNGTTFTSCADCTALALILHKIRNELIYARCWPKQDELAFEEPASKARRAQVAKIAEGFLKKRASGRIIHGAAEYMDDDGFVEDNVRGCLDIPDADVVYVAFDWEFDGLGYQQTEASYRRETGCGISYGWFACTQRGLYVMVDDGELSHTRLISWDEYAEFMVREFAELPDGGGALFMGNWLYGNLDESYNLYGELFYDLYNVLKDV